jgi:Protein of unknown function (DUF3617)
MAALGLSACALGLLHTKREMLMRKTMLAGVAMLAAIQVSAGGIGLKAGLWETHLVKSVMDGRDMTAQVAGASAQMQQAMANMTPEQRARIEAMMKDRVAPAPGGNGTWRMCITPEQAAKDKPFVDREGCQPTTVNRSGNHATFEFSCTRNGNTTAGKGEATISGDTIATVVDTTIKRANGDTHVVHSESEMKFIGADCGDVKPITPPKDSP